jgi:Ca-activated chloride channel family protein
MFRFEHPGYLYALGLLPVLALLFFLYWRWRRRAIERFGERSLIEALMPEASKWKQHFKFGLLLLAITFLIVGWANPQWGTKREKTTRKSVDVFVALDISNSMLAEDVPPNRLERAKKFAEELVEEIKGERVGLIYFAGNAYLQMPVTTDYAAAEIFLRSANTDQAGTQGTAIGAAIEMALESYDADNQRHKALVIITDGEDHDGEAMTQAATAAEQNVLLFTVGVGSPEGGFIPFNYGGRSDYKRDASGQPVRTRMNESMLKEIAAKGKGAYFPIASSLGVAEALRQNIDKMEKREFEVRGFESYNSYYQYFIGIAILLLVFEFVVTFRREKWLEGRDIFK